MPGERGVTSVFKADEETPEIRDAVLPSGTVAAEGLVAWFRSAAGAPRLPEPIVIFME